MFRKSRAVLVFVKPPNARCTTSWKIGIVTGVTSTNNVAVDGVPRHVSDVRPQPHIEKQDADLELEAVVINEVDNGNGLFRRSTRVTAPPWRYDASDF
jgi:hypothetical protein